MGHDDVIGSIDHRNKRRVKVNGYMNIPQRFKESV